MFYRNPRACIPRPPARPHVPPRPRRTFHDVHPSVYLRHACGVAAPPADSRVGLPAVRTSAEARRLPTHQALLHAVAQQRPMKATKFSLKIFFRKIIHQFFRIFQKKKIQKKINLKKNYFLKKIEKCKELYINFFQFFWKKKKI